MMGTARVTERWAGSLSSVTVRGEAMTLAVASWFMKERTAWTPSALRKPTPGVNPLAPFHERPPPPRKVWSTLAELELGWVVIVRPLGKVVVVAAPGVVVMFWLFVLSRI